ncbi:MBL fold metallo-hydrolase [Thermosynechococcus sp. PP45]|uniref:MBL fold metallo-hydrolase n=1 Tax=unclassified Thermosynechococcus TaxID=2622553 RepID=UPI0026718940|nr:MULTISPECIES: MBL fold metallo-hydrolase [unclassified Thermosynechococcus]MDR7992063.1 MBL fold metallo-hydrolase [Thermosynechococcus sp. TG252]WKT81352.1 MBL fold metallo-hydrolase [Thermosynechococcus sp. PP45]WNC24964.1 MBL fold metallo-hydrolase [Thermosynechococcus sp. PP551]WNC27541.1 MBL fold metallo-hydrolase [Thermosynechococcus sp. PP555]
MRLKFFGGATAILEHKNKRILFDPWLDDGIFHGAWYHYPPLRVGIEDIGHVDYVYISHIHEDHCSAGTIQHINKDAEVILMDRNPNFVLNFLKSNGFTFRDVHCIPARSPKKLFEDLIVDIVEPDPGYHQLNTLVDSALVIKWDGFVIFNANDCTPYKDAWEYIKTTYGKVDLALLPYTGGSGYPACYHNLSHAEKLKEKQRIANQGIQGFVDAVLYLKPTYAMPFADQYVIAGSRSNLNEYLPHPPEGSAVLEALKEYSLDSRVLLLNSGQSFDLSTAQKIPDEPYVLYSESDRQKYIEEYLKDKVYDHEKIELNPSVNFRKLLNYARMNLWNAQKKENFFPDFRYVIEISDRNLLFVINMKNEDLQELTDVNSAIEPYLKIKVSSTLLGFLLIGHISWNIADAALFIDYDRRPNIYNPLIHAMLNFLRL